MDRPPFQEGSKHKGGVNEPPTGLRPGPPKPQKPEAIKANVANLYNKIEEKTGRITPESLRDELNRGIQAGGIEGLVIVYRLKDGTIANASTTMDSMQIIGMLEAAKALFMNEFMV